MTSVHAPCLVITPCNTDPMILEILGVPVTATTDDIRKAYRRRALQLHPDKNRDDPNAEEQFKLLAIAYQTLSDPTARRKYNEFGPKESAPEGGFVDPEEVFSAIFGGERFVPIIGHISLAQDMKTAMQEADDEPDAATAAGPSNAIQNGEKGKLLSPEEKAKKDEQARVLSAEVRLSGQSVHMSAMLNSQNSVPGFGKNA